MATSSVGEVLRNISAVTNCEVSTDIFNRADKMDEITCQLLAKYFDLSPNQFSRAFMLKLMNGVAVELQFPQAFYISDLEDTRDRKKWMDFLSCIVHFLQFKLQYKVSDEFYKEIINKKQEYVHLLEFVSKRENEFKTSQAEIKSKQEAVEKLRVQYHDMKSRRCKLDGEYSGFKSLVDSLQNELSKRLENIEKLKREIADLELENERLSKDILENADTFVSSIPAAKAQLDEIEAEMHKLFEKRTNIMERTTEFLHYKPLLDELHLDDIYAVLDRYATLKQQEKALQKQQDIDSLQLEAMQTEKEELIKRMSDLQSEMMRLKLLLAKKRKAAQTNKRSWAKELGALERETAELNVTVLKSERTLKLTEEQVKLGRSENDRLDQELAEADKLAGQLAEIHKKLLALM